MNAMRLTGCRVGLGLAAVAAAAGMNPKTANADPWGINVSLGGGQVWVPPVYETQARTVTTPAVYETRSRRVWIEPVYDERRFVVDVPARTAIREVPRYGTCGRVIAYDRVAVIVEPAHREERTERVLVQPGRWEIVTEQICVRPEQSEVVYENVLVAPGHWEQNGGLAFGYRHGRSDAVRVVAGPHPWNAGFHADVRVRH